MDPFSPGAQPYLAPPPNVPPAMEPLHTDHSEAVDDIEVAVQEAFVAVFEAAIRPRLRGVNAHGVPHRADFATLERFVKVAGLALDRRADGEAFMRELYRAWVANNPRRGLAFLRLALRLLYPGVHTIDQLWQDPIRQYPGGANATPGASKWLTSRVRVTLDAGSGLTVADLYRARSIMMSIVPARIVLELSIDLGDPIESTVGLAAAASAEQTWALECTV